MAATANSTPTDREPRGLRGWFSGLRVVAALFGHPWGLARRPTQAWLYVCELSRLAPGESLTLLTPTGATVTVARRDPAPILDSFLAMSSTCPHVGCQVHWQAEACRFSCPCHSGALTPDGQGTHRCPAPGGQSLLRYPLKIDNGLLFLAVPVDSTASD
ncbi:MAG: Rieske (2Fe-2S) protein [Thermoanaerobaculia bacterium]|nr:Rieske (2Fe-2S) protein [Thermoanaerobaculia bacterium]